MLRILNMAPSNQTLFAKKLWFVSPWKLEKQDPKHLAYQPATTLQPGLDGDVEYERARLQGLPKNGLDSRSISNPNDVHENDLVNDGVLCLPALEDETRIEPRKMLSDHEVQIFSDPILHKIVHIVTFQGHSIYK